MLIVVKNGNLHSLAEFLFNVETFRCLDVFQVDAAERWLERRDDIDQFVRITLVYFDIKNINTREFLEQYRFAFHDWLRRKGADCTQPKHGSAIGNDADQIAASREIACLRRIFDDGFADLGHTGGVGERQIALRGQGLGGGNFYLAGDRVAVIFERGRF